MKDIVQNVMHDNKGVDDIILLKYVAFQCSNNTSKCKQCFMKDLVQSLIHD